MNPEAQDVQSEALTVTGAPQPITHVPTILLEDRVQRLEEMVASLTQAQGWDEEQPVLPRQESAASTPRLSHGEVHRAVPIPPPPTASLAEFSLPPLAQAPPVRPLSSLLKPMQSALPVAASTMANRVLSPSSLWRDLWWDLRTAWRMVRDPAYPMTTACRVVPAFAIFYVTIWPLLSSWSGVIGTVMNYFVNAIVIYVAFKVVQRELRRYYDFAEKYRR